MCQIYLTIAEFEILFEIEFSKIVCRNNISETEQKFSKYSFKLRAES